MNYKDRFQIFIILNPSSEIIQASMCSILLENDGYFFNFEFGARRWIVDTFIHRLLKFAIKQSCRLINTHVINASHYS